MLIAFSTNSVTEYLLNLNFIFAFCCRNWNARVWSPLVELLDTWTPLLPPWIMGNILDQLVLPRLQSEVDAWNPLTDTLPVHSWIHPWLPLMGDYFLLGYFSFMYLITFLL